MGMVRRCVDDYKMIEANDRIAVGLSGGKDSIALLALLAAMREYYPLPYELTAISIDLGFGMDFSPIRGPEGNIEYLAWLEKDGAESIVPDLDTLIEASHAAHGKDETP